MKLSILIASLACRRDLLARLMNRLGPQNAFDVEAIVNADNGELTIGEKRNRLLDGARGQFIAFIDDDDLVAPNYVACILAEIEHGPDVIGFRSTRYLDDKRLGDCIYSIGVGNNDEPRPGDTWQFNRTPSHLCPVRCEHALATRFEPWCYGEDRDYAARILPLLKVERFIDADMYSYYIRTKERREHETTHPLRWCDDNQRIERSFLPRLPDDGQPSLTA